MPESSECLTLADQLLTAADERPDERVRLGCAAEIAANVASDVQNEPGLGECEYLIKLIQLLEPGVTHPLGDGVLNCARAYRNMAETWLRQRKKNAQPDQEEKWSEPLAFPFPPQPAIPPRRPRFSWLGR